MKQLKSKRIALLSIFCLSIMFILSGCRGQEEPVDVIDPTEGLPALSEVMDSWYSSVDSANTPCTVQVIFGVTDSLASELGLPSSELLGSNRTVELKWNGKPSQVIMTTELNSNSTLSVLLSELYEPWYISTDSEKIILSPQVRASTEGDDSEQALSGGRKLTELLRDGLVGEDAIDVLKMNISDVIYQVRIITPYDMIQTSGDEQGVEVHEDTILVDMLRLNDYSNENMIFEPEMLWTAQVTYGGTAEALQKLGLYSQVSQQSSYMTYGEVQYMVTQETIELSTANLDAMQLLGENCWKLLPSKDYFDINSELVPLEEKSDDGRPQFGVLLHVSQKNRASTLEAVPAKDMLWLQKEVYVQLKLTHQEGWNGKQVEGDKVGSSLDGQTLTLDLTGMTFDRTYSWSFSPENTEMRTDPEGVAFADVKPEDWFYDAVMACAEAGIVSGKSEGEFDPNGTLTVAEWAVILERALGEVYEDGHEYWAHGALELALQQGLWVVAEDEEPLEATPESANVPITREAAIYGLYVALGKDPIARLDTVQIPDLDQATEERKLIVASAYQNGLISGNTNGEIMPKSSLTRAQFCQMLYNSGMVQTEVENAGNSGNN